MRRATLLVMSVLLGSAAYAADSYPTCPVRFLIPAPPGSTVDHIARLIAAPLTEQLDKPFVLDNRSGAGGVIAAEMIANAAPDGYTLGMIYTSYTTNEVVSGQVAYQFAGPIMVLALGRAGRLRLLGVTSLKRAAALPDLPTVDESGVPGMEVINWFGAVAPPATPRHLIDRLHTEIKRALANADVRTRLASEGSEIVATTPAAFRAFIRSDVEKWARVVKSSGIHAA